MNRPSIIDTDGAARSRYLELIAAVPAPERLTRALALTAFVRNLTWQGATYHVGHLGSEAVVERFAQQLYGREIGEQIASSLLSSP